MATTSIPTNLTAPTWVARAQDHFRRPLERSGYALLLASLVNSALGFGFWAVAARWYPADAVGTATALIAAMTFLATLSTLGLRGGLLRFLPVSGPDRGRLIRRTYVACAAAAALAATGFVAGSEFWAADLTVLREPLVSAGFVVAVIAWVIYTLQEQVLAGLGRALLVPLVASGYAVAKLVLLVMLTGAAAWGVFGAFTAPALLAVGAVSAFVFLRLVREGPARAGETSTGSGPPSVGVLVRFAAGDHTATLLGLAAVDLLPLLVLAHLGPSASAYYYVAFTAAFVLYLVTSNVGSALVVEASRRPDRLTELARRTLRNAGVIVGVAVAVGVVAAGPLLRLLGEDYAEQATTLMQLVLLSALPGVVVGVSGAVARVHRRTRILVATNAALAVMVFAGAEIGLRTWGLTGVGVAWVAAETILAVVLLGTQMRFVLLGAGGPVLAAAARARTALHRRARHRLARRLVPRVLPDTAWTLLTSDNDTLVVATERAGRPVVVKLALSARAEVALARHVDAVVSLRDRADLGAWRSLLPHVLERGRVEHRPYVVESRLPGRVAAGSDEREAVAVAVAVVVSGLHRTTLGSTGPDVLRERVAASLARLARLPGSAARADALRRLGDALAVRAADEVAVSQTHGDCWLGNVLVARGEPRVTGVVDWENASDRGLPDVDLAHLWLGTRGTEVGVAVRTAFAADPGALDAWLEAAGVHRTYRSLPARVALTLAWIDHVAGEVDRAAPTRTWTARTVDEVLPVVIDALEAEPTADPTPDPTPDPTAAEVRTP